MVVSGVQRSPSLGFLTVCQRESSTLLGGYLVLNLAGRPMEFHCTAPVRPSRAQEILYGPTLKPYLCGEQIGRTLIDSAKARPGVVFTDVVDAMAVRDHIALPVVYVFPKGDPADGEVKTPARIDGAHEACPPPFSIRLRPFTIGDQRLAVVLDHEEDERRIVEAWQGRLGDFDLSEPFGRIRDAIDEAYRSAR